MTKLAAVKENAEDQAEDTSKTFSIKYHEINVVLETTTRMYGGIPQSEDLLRAWITAKGPMPKESLEEKIEAMTTDEIDEKMELSSTGFRSDEDGIYMRDFMVKQMMKESATAVGMLAKKIGTKTNLTIGLVVKPERIHIGKTHPDGYEEFQGRVKTMQGPRSIMSRKAYFDPGLQIAFEIKMLAGGKLTPKDVLALLNHAGEFVGFGSARSREAGKFKVVRFMAK
jgi:hypothetical protein